MTIFAAALRLVGLSHAEAASFFGVRPDTVKSWSSGRNRIPAGVWARLRDLYETQQVAVDAALDLIDEKQPDEIAPDIAGPRSKQWPSPGAHMAVAAAVALSIDLPIADGGAGGRG